MNGNTTNGHDETLYYVIAIMRNGGSMMAAAVAAAVSWLLWLVWRNIQ